MIADLIEYTTRNVFLTGKAGTGKTTFLNTFVKSTHKKYVIAAPTGIAAINAGGITLHSLFGLPMNNFIPTNEFVNADMALNRTQLIHHFRYNSQKRKLFTELELLIIDEASMLRADILDAIDLALRTVRKNQSPFGGVQLLCIGDLYQLPPVVRLGKELMEQYYPSLFFFEAHALKEKALITVNLEKIYRQTDAVFIDLLNEVRNGQISDEKLQLLNSRFLPDFDPKQEKYVYLVSHNQLADTINQKKINALKGKAFQFKAAITGSFKENQFPNEEELSLKVGAQIMFIKNDSSTEKRYYNGKIAEIIALSTTEIVVKTADTNDVITLNKEVWEQKSFEVNKHTQEIEQKVLGSYKQYPIKLAWAVTIHKSQGLTFDKVIIDAGNSFVSGQVYVALSRCRTLEGIVLKTRIARHAIFTDTRVKDFQNSSNANEFMTQIIDHERYDYELFRMKECLNFNAIYDALLSWKALIKNQKQFDSVEINQLIANCIQKVQEWEKTTQSFINFLQNQFQFYKALQNNKEAIIEKSEKAIAYFLGQLDTTIISPSIKHFKEIKGKDRLKNYEKQITEVIEHCEDKVKKLKHARVLGESLYHISESEALEDEAISVKNIKKTPTETQTFELFNEGKSIQEIAKIRNLTPSTILSHFTKLVAQGKVEATAVVSKEKIALFEKLFKVKNHDTLTEWKKHLPPTFEFGEIRILIQYCLLKK